MPITNFVEIMNLLSFGKDILKCKICKQNNGAKFRNPLPYEDNEGKFYLQRICKCLSLFECIQKYNEEQKSLQNK